MAERLVWEEEDYSGVYLVTYMYMHASNDELFCPTVITVDRLCSCSGWLRDTNGVDEYSHAIGW